MANQLGFSFLMLAAGIGIPVMAALSARVGTTHGSPALAYPWGGRTRTMTLSEEDVPLVRAALENYQAAREELDRAADAEIAALPGQRAARRPHRRG